MTQPTPPNRRTFRGRVARMSLFVGASLGAVMATAAYAQSAPQKAPPQRAPAVSEPAKDAEPVVDPRADRKLREMSDYLDSLKAFTFEANSTTDVVTEEGQKLQFGATSDIAMKRPDQIRSDRKGSMTDVTLAYDGKSILLYGKNLNAFAKSDAPPTIDEAIDFARDKLGLEVPGADLLYTGSYDVLMEDVCTGTYVGEEVLDGVRVDHLAFVGRNTDFQIWIEAGKRPLPRKFVITSKDMEGAPDFTVQLDDWNVNPTIAANTFRFTPPRNAERIDFLQQVETDEAKP